MNADDLEAHRKTCPWCSLGPVAPGARGPGPADRPARPSLDPQPVGACLRVLLCDSEGLALVTSDPGRLCSAWAHLAAVPGRDLAVRLRAALLEARRRLAELDRSRPQDPRAAATRDELLAPLRCHALAAGALTAGGQVGLGLLDLTDRYLPRWDDQGRQLCASPDLRQAAGLLAEAWDRLARADGQRPAGETGWVGALEWLGEEVGTA